MPNFTDLTVGQLNQIISIKEQIQVLRGQIESVVNDGGEIPIPFSGETRKKRRMSAAGRARIAAAQKARWAKLKGTTATPKAVKKRRKISPEVKAKLAAIARARWAKVRAAGKKTL